MAFQPVPDVAKAAVTWQRAGKQFITTFYWEFTGGYSQGALNDLAAAVDLVIGTEWLPILPAVIAYTGTEITGLATPNDLFAFDATSIGVGSITDSEYASSQVTLAIKRTSNNTGRSARGRVFWPGFATIQLTGAGNNFVEAAPLSNAIDAVDEMRLLDIAGDESPVIVSRYTNGVIRAEGVTFPWIATSVTDNRVDTLRGRLPLPA